ncbi:rhythmically expressed gene 5 protein [Microplitis demolitor]|uniref:rhythmically expressed gene 5 protein n=1 Tax=Microplitis demolitor TaxID=69319 RepID=UPI00043FFED7|nr:rhythmically expressed gene 5 protein [Microplitis demolitor]
MYYCKNIIILVLVTILIIQNNPINGSAIPMWEFLSKNEKMSHLYRLFSKEVASYCDGSPKPDCTKNNLVSGLQKLASMDENQLDELDPYQRNAVYKIWRALVGENQFNSNDRFDATDSYTEVDPLATSDNDANDLGEESSVMNDYVRPIDNGPYLVGPMVIRVLPDGRPVPGDDKRPLPHDEDLDDLQNYRVPLISELQSHNNRLSSYNNKKLYNTNINSLPTSASPVSRVRYLTTPHNYYYRNPFFYNSNNINRKPELLRKNNYRFY